MRDIEINARMQCMIVSVNVCVHVVDEAGRGMCNLSMLLQCFE